MEVRLRDSQGNLVQEAIPGELHQLEIRLQSQPNANAYGFQAIILDSFDTQKGSIDSLSSRLRVASANGRSYVEHRTSFTDTLVRVYWRAPANPGTSNLRFFGVVNAVNLNRGTGGDQARQQAFEWPYRASSSTNDPYVFAKAIRYQMNGDCNLEFWISDETDQAEGKSYSWELYDVLGRAFAKTGSTGQQRATVNLAALGEPCMPGSQNRLYVLKACQDGACTSTWVAISR